jgi:hypothetical protein
MDSKYQQYYTRCAVDPAYLWCNICFHALPAGFVLRQNQKCKGRYKHIGKQASTTSLKRHLETEHNISLSAETEHLSTVDKAVAFMLLHHDCAFRMVDCGCFKAVVDAIRESNDAISNADTFRSSIIPRLYNSDKENTIQTFFSQDFVCIALDHWSSPGRHSYLMVIAQCVTSLFKLEFRLLGAYQVDDHLALTTNCLLLDIMHEYNITSKVIAIVSDTTESMLAAVRETVQDCHPLCSPLGCFAHVFQLAVRKGLTQSTIVDLVRSTTSKIGFMNRSEKFTAKLWKTTVSGVTGHSPILSCDTRWDSVAIMLSSVVNQFSCINVCLLEYARENPRLTGVPAPFTAAEIRAIELLLPILLVLESLTKSMQYRQSNVGNVIPIVTVVLTMCGERDNTTIDPMLQDFYLLLFDEFVAQVQKHFIAEGTYPNWVWKPVYVMAAMMSPCYRASLAQSDNYASYCDTFRAEISLWVARLDTPEFRDKLLPNRTKKLKLDAADIIANPNSVLQFCSRTHNTETPEQSFAGLAGVEINKYLNCAIDSSQTGLIWWLCNARQYPILAHIAKFYLSITSTESDCERMGSSCERLIDNKRTRMKPNFVKKSMC